ELVWVIEDTKIVDDPIALNIGLIYRTTRWPGSAGSTLRLRNRRSCGRWGTAAEGFRDKAYRE
ncbi:MAG: hypothetical protein AAFV32_04900, partial [Myxococcota bacterium]